MTPIRSAVVALLCGLVVVGTQAFQDPSWPPTSLAPLDPEAPARSPADELATFVLAPGFRAELVASEPLVEDPVAIDWDPAGRLWVVEMPGYHEDLASTTESQPLGRIVVLEDLDGDGLMDRRTVFADGFVLARAIKVLDAGVLVAEPPNLWLLTDADGNLKADGRQLVTDRYGRGEANVEHNANGLYWALDNWIYTSESDMYLRYKDGRFEVAETLSRGQWGLSQDDAGRVYRNTNSSALFVDLVPARYYMRREEPGRTRGLYESLGGGDLNVTWPLMPTTGVNRGYQLGVLREDGTLASFTAVNSPLIYRGDRLPADLYGNAFLAEPSANLISRVIIEDTGSSLSGRKAYEQAEFLASTDERFRPVFLSSAPDGTLYVVDMYRGIIQHRGYITEYLRDQILSRHLDQQIHRGRIWRIVHETTERGPRPALDQASPAELVAALAHPNGWWRDTAQRLLVERGDPAATAPLTATAEQAADPRARLHALWALDGLDRIQPATVIAALAAESRDVRVSALRLSERWLDSRPDVQDAVMGRLDDGDWNVRQQLAATAGFLPESRRATAVAAILERYATDPVVLDAAMSGVAGHEEDVLAVLLAQAPTTEKEIAIATLVAAIVDGENPAAIGRILAMASDPARPAWQREALVLGAEVALLNAPPPGTPARGRGAAGGGRGQQAEAPCPTCPGARGGPGGAPAFQAPRAGGGGGGAARGGGGGGRGGRGSAPLTMVAAEPAAFVALARGGEALSARATALLDRLGWPGKAGMDADVEDAIPLTPEEATRFAAGAEVFANICQACHQANGRGAEGLAASLVGSPIATGPAALPIRALLNGKEGTVGLMPPLGATMSDQDLAAVLTYVRRSFGHTATPVTPAEVAAVRATATERTRPWTDAELLATVEDN